MTYRIRCVMFSVLDTSAVDREFNYIIGICCFSTKYATLWSKSKDWLTRIQDNASEWNDMSTSGFPCLIYALQKSEMAELN